MRGGQIQRYVADPLPRVEVLKRNEELLTTFEWEFVANLDEVYTFPSYEAADHFAADLRTRGYRCFAVVIPIAKEPWVCDLSAAERHQAMMKRQHLD